MEITSIRADLPRTVKALLHTNSMNTIYEELGSSLISIGSKEKIWHVLKVFIFLLQTLLQLLTVNHMKLCKTY